MVGAVSFGLEDWALRGERLQSRAADAAQPATITVEGARRMNGTPGTRDECFGAQREQRITDGVFSRGIAVKALAAGLLGGLARLVAAPVPDAEARKRQLTTLWAVVESNATLRRGKGVVSVNRWGPTGEYAVTFNRDVSRCVYAATTTDQAMGLINASSHFGDGVLVITGTAASTFTAANVPFNLVVQC
jgi:hypothetical protein